MNLTTFKDDTGCECLTVTAATAMIRVRAREYPAQSGLETDIRMTLEDGIPRHTNGPLTLNLANLGPLGLDVGVEAVSTWYTLWLIPHPTITDQLSAVFSVQPPTGRPTGYPVCRYVGCVRNDAAGDLVALVQQGDRSDPFQALVVENVPALDGAAVDLDLTAVVPPWAAAAMVQINMVKDAAAGAITVTIWQDDGAAVPAARAVQEHVFQLEADAAVHIGNHEFLHLLTGRRGHLWRQRVSGGAAVLTNWQLLVTSFWDQYVR